MTMTSTRTTRRFIAVIGFVDTPTNEPYPRILMRPQAGHAIRPDSLLPVREITGNTAKNVGTIYDVVILGNQLIALGYLGMESAGDEVRINDLKDGQIHMELDVDSGRVREEQFGVEFYGWCVRAVTLGTAPTWILPPVHVWET
jgi:hypothetical protein